MHRLPLPDELPYQFQPPKLSPFWVRASRLYVSYLLRRTQVVREIDDVGLEHLKALKGKGDGVLITPNHPDLADPAVMFMISRRAGVPFCYMAAYQIFTGNAGLRKFILPRLGVFPVDREGADRSAFQAGLNVLTQGKNPLVVFPEGRDLLPRRSSHPAARGSRGAGAGCRPEGRRARADGLDHPHGDPISLPRES